MTELAHSVTHPGINHRPLVNGNTPARRRRTAPWAAGSVLELSGGVPQTINVTIEDGVPKFALAGSTDTYREIGWQTDGYSLMITFVFGASITEVGANTPSAWFSDTYTQSGQTCQVCCVPSIPGEYHFNVFVELGVLLSEAIDPKIVVTPIT